MLETITFPETVISMSIEPVSAAERNKLGEALTTLRKEDPTFKCKYDTETGQTIISGMGELHLEILQNKLIRDLGVKVRVGKPRVAYKEAIVNAGRRRRQFIRRPADGGIRTCGYPD
jgi:elongation factor G